MFRIWGRTFKNNKMIKNTTIEIDNPEMTRTHKVFKALEDICEEFDLSNQSGLIIILMNSNAFHEPDFIRTVLLNILILII